MQDASVNLEDMSFCRKLVHTFINDEVKYAYYRERTVMFTNVLPWIFVSKISTILFCFRQITEDWEGYRERDPFLKDLYPRTPEGDAEFKRHNTWALLQHVVSAILIISCWLMIRRNIDLARWYNPVVLTFAFMIHQPVMPVYDITFNVFALGSQFIFALIVTFIVAETLLGSLLCYSCIYHVLGLTMDRIIVKDAWSRVDIQVYVGAYLACMLITF